MLIVIGSSRGIDNSVQLPEKETKEIGEWLGILPNIPIFMMRSID